MVSGDVYCWGSNIHGQLGRPWATKGADGKYVRFDFTPTATKVEGISNARSVTGGQDFTCAIKTDDTTYCWGANNQGQLGHEPKYNPEYFFYVEFSPVQVMTIGGSIGTVATKQPLYAKQMASGDGHSCAIGPDKSVSCWGKDNEGQLGNGWADVNGLYDVAVKIPNFTATAISAKNATTCAIDEALTVKCWGYNQYSVAGKSDPQAPFYNVVPEPTSITDKDGNELTNEGGVAVGTTHALAYALVSDPVQWGEIIFGTGPTAYYNSAQLTVGLPLRPVEMAAGNYFSCARMVEGQVYCWGKNDKFQITNADKTGLSTKAIVIVL